MAHSIVRRALSRFKQTGALSTASNVLTITDVPEKGFLVRVHVVNGGGTCTPILTEHSAATDAISKIVEFSSAELEQDEVTISPVYYEAHNDSGVYKIYLKPVSSTNTTCSYAIDIEQAG
tara:strand:+ start:867 stop:1226 length:360 start_codon:yes stop_codon:yes gene_type:complete